MVSLDFDARYKGEHKNEIGLLGDNINMLSESLEIINRASREDDA